MKVIPRGIDEITPYARNPRKNEAAVDAVAASIREFGFRQPIVVDRKGTIVCGETRFKAARKLGLKKVPVHVAEGLTAAQAKAYRIADNRLAEIAGWDTELLPLELSDLKAADFDLGLLGFDQGELDGLLHPDGTPGLTDPDEVPQPPKKPVTRPGDLWTLGTHRLLCGDSTRAADVKRLMNGQRADLLFTSPPYLQQRKYLPAAADHLSDWDGLMRGVFGLIPMTDAGQVLVNLGLIHRNGEWLPYWDAWIEWMRSQKWRRFGLYVWDQGAGLPGDWNGRLAPCFEFIWHFNRASLRPAKTVKTSEESRRHKGQTVPIGFRKTGGSKAAGSPQKVGQDWKIPDSVIRIARSPIDGRLHPATFPVGLAVFVLRCWPGLVLDPFLGSGATLIAAEQLGRVCYGMEIEPAYCDVTVKRWENLTGKKAARNRPGRKPRTGRSRRSRNPE